MKKIYISLPISGHEKDYEQRLDAAVKYVKEMYPEYGWIVTPKELAEDLDDFYKQFYKYKPSYKDYLLRDIKEISESDAIFMSCGWSHSKGCRAEHKFAKAIGIKVIYQSV